MTIDVRTEEIGEDLMCYSDLLTDTIHCKCTVEKLPEHPAQSRMPDGINMEWETFEAQRGAKTRAVRAMDDENEDMEDDLDEPVAGTADKNEEGKNGDAEEIKGIQKKKGGRVTSEGRQSFNKLFDYDELDYDEHEEDEEYSEHAENSEDARG